MIFKTLTFVVLLSAHWVFAQKELGDILQAQCKSAGAKNDITAVLSDYVQCVALLMDERQLGALNNGNMGHGFEVIFTGICSKKTQVKSCYYTLVDGVTPCLGSTTPVQVSSIKQGISQLFDHSCDSMPEFLAEKGFDCILGKVFTIKDCMDEFGPLYNFIAMNFNDKCTKFHQFSKCFIDKLDGCGPVVNKILETNLQDLSTIFTCA